MDPTQFFTPTTGNMIKLNHAILKQIFPYTTTNSLIEHMIQVIETILQTHKQIVVVLDLSKLTINDIEKYKQFIQESAIILSNKFTDILQVCYITNAPFIVTQLIKVFAIFIDKDKIILVDERVTLGKN